MFLVLLHTTWLSCVLLSHWPLRLAGAGYASASVSKWRASPTLGLCGLGLETHVPPFKMPKEAVRTLHAVPQPGLAAPVGCTGPAARPSPTHRLAAEAAAALQRLAGVRAGPGT